MAQTLNNHIPEITKTPNWTSDNVRRACIRNELYTLGDSESYLSMLEKVDVIKTPSDIGVYIIAKDIAEHSEGQTVSNVMYILANEAIFYTFALDGRCDI